MKKKNYLNVFLSLLMTTSLGACAQSQQETQTEEAPQSTNEEPEETVTEETEETTEEEATEKNGDIYILVTSDVHCGIDQGFGYAGLQQVRDTLEQQGYTTLLVDDGDSIQGEAIGTLSKGEAMIDLMNEMHYDVAIPGNHEFDYGMERFLELADKAEFPYISCNINKEGELVFSPYVIKEAAGKKIAFVGITTPKTITSSTPAYFQNENHEFIYGFMQGETGDRLYEAVQKAVDDARAEGADYVYVMAHCGNEETCVPYTYADIISNTNGIDVFLDGHSHDTEQVVMQNKDGDDVIRCAVGTKMNCIGYSRISAEEGIVETDIWSWPNKTCAMDLLNIQNDIAAEIKASKEVLAEQLNEVLANTETELTIYDPVAKDESGNPVLIVRRTETNLGDLCADAMRAQSGADIGFVNGGGVRKNIAKGDVTYGNIIDVFPFGNMLTVVEASGQEILDALEWGARAVPDQTGGFLQVSGVTFDLDVSIPSGCIQDENAMFAGIEGERRIKNVKVNGEDIDPQKTYTVACFDYILLNRGGGYTMFADNTVLQNAVKLDNQVLIDYITEDLGGVIGEEYSNPYGQGRINIINGE